MGECTNTVRYDEQTKLLTLHAEATPVVKAIQQSTGAPVTVDYEVTGEFFEFLDWTAVQVVGCMEIDLPRRTLVRDFEGFRHFKAQQTICSKTSHHLSWG